MDDKLHFGIAGGSGDFKHEGVESNVRGAVPTANRSWWPVNKLETFDQWTNVVDGYEGEDGNDGYADEEEEASQADDESTRNVEDWGHSRFDRGTSIVDWYECEDGDDADVREAGEASQADDGSTQNVKDSGHCTRECED